MQGDDDRNTTLFFLIEKKSPVTSQGLSSSWTVKQTVYYGSILVSELIRQYSS